MRAAFAALAAIGLLSLGACAEEPLEAPQASLDNIQAIRAANLAPMRVGAFTAGPGRPAAMDKSVSVRAGTQAAPKGSYAQFLADTLAAELQGAGKLDPASPLVVSAVLTDTHVDSGTPKARAWLEARFTVTRAGQQTYDKSLRVEDTWDGNFMGAVAIPDAFNHYAGLFPALVTRLLTDPDFRAATRGT